jgi:hypothetical protein
MPRWAKLLTWALGGAMIAGPIAWFVWASLRVFEARHWPSAQGTVVAARVEIDTSESTDAAGRRHSSAVYYPVITYTYRVANRAYRADRVWLTSAPRWSDAADARAFLADYRVGGPVPVFYDPADPSDATLTLEGPTPMVFLVAVMGLICIAVPFLFGRDSSRWHLRHARRMDLARQLLRNRRL